MERSIALETARHIVDSLTNRRGLRHEFDQFDEEITAEVHEEIASHVAEGIRRTAEARATTSRQEALEEAARVADEYSEECFAVWTKGGRGDEHMAGRSDGASSAADRIRALATPPASASPSSSENTPAG